MILRPCLVMMNAKEGVSSGQQDSVSGGVFHQAMNLLCGQNLGGKLGNCSQRVGGMETCHWKWGLRNMVSQWHIKHPQCQSDQDMQVPL